MRRIRDAGARAWKRHVRLLAGAVVLLGLGGALFVTALVASSPGTARPTRSASAAAVASSHTLAFTGIGKGITWVAIVGGVFFLVGCTLLVFIDAPRRVLKKL